jgi:BACON domain-containing protein/all-beta uncharacterized protein
MADASALRRALISAANLGVLVCSLQLSACGSSGTTVTSPSLVSKCPVNFDTPTTPLPAAGGSGSVEVKTQRDCQWAAQPDVGWLNITAGSSGQGDGSVQFNAAPNSEPSARTGGIMLNTQRVQVTQAAAECQFELAHTSGSFPQSGGSGSVDLRASSALCAWTIASDVPWIEVSTATGKGSMSVVFKVTPTTGPPRTGALTIAGLHFSVTQSEGCTFAISPDSQNVPASGGTGSLTVTAEAGCPWTATSNAAWLTITSATSASGNASVAFSAAATTGPGRSGTLTIAGRTFTVNQGQGCTFTTSTTSASAPPDGGTGTFEVRTTDGCGWAAASNASWLTVTGDATGSGNGTVHYEAAANTGSQRTGTITAGGQPFIVTQGVGCSYSISPVSQNISNGGGSASVTVTAPAGCSWTSSSNASWIGISAGTTGAGNGLVQLVIAAHADAARSGTVTIAGQTFTINQASGCTYSISPSNATVPAAGGSGSFGVAAGGTCGWTATTSVAWITITSGASAAGSGMVQFAVAANTGAARSGLIITASQTFTVAQETGCSAVVTPDTLQAPASGGSQNVKVSTPPECSWTAASNVAWIGISNSNSGSGNDTVQLDVQPNTGPVRTGTATIAGTIVTVDQADGCTFSTVPPAQSIPVGGGTGSVTVSAGAGCPWTAVSNVSWITVTRGANGSGGGTVQFMVNPNATDAARAGTITIAGQVFTVNQAGK